MNGLQPRGFTWVISGRLAVSERVGGYGFQHRRVRREEEIAWLAHAGITVVVSLLEGNQNLTAYRAAGMEAHHAPLAETDSHTVTGVFRVMHGILRNSSAVLLVHRDTIDDQVAGLLAGYLVYSGLVRDPIVATAAIQEILRRPLGPEARAMIPETTGA
jgi:hypothetical protein